MPDDCRRRDRNRFAADWLHVQPQRLARLIGQREQACAVGKIARPLVFEARGRQVNRLSAVEGKKTKASSVPRCEAQRSSTVRRQPKSESLAQSDRRVVVKLAKIYLVLGTASDAALIKEHRASIARHV